MLVAVAVIPALLGAVFLVVGFREVGTLRQLRSGGARAEGTVVGRYSFRGGSAPRFSFTAADGTEVVTRHRLTVTLGPVRTGTSVRVAYDPADPKVARILDPYYAIGNGLAAALFVVAGLAFLAAAGVLTSLALTGG